MKNFFHKTFSSLKIRNYRLYYTGQFISLSGTFLQALAQDWLVLKLTNSGVMLGLVSALQFLPMLLLTPLGGLIADKFPKLRLLYITQTTSAVLAILLGVLVLTGTIQVWMVFIFALCLGLTNSLDNPSRQSFVSEMVGKDEVKNAVSLWVVLIGSTRIIGPAIAGILIATVGIGFCFVINGLSYVAVIIGLLMIRKEELHLSQKPYVAYAKGQIKEGYRYVRSNPLLWQTLMMMAIIGTFTFEWQASLPLFARFVLHGDAATYSALASAQGVGMLIGGFSNTMSANISQKKLNYAALGFGITTIIAALLSSVTLGIIAFAVVGIFSIVFANLTNTILQVTSEPEMRGRVMAFWAMAFVGSTTIGGPIIGWVGQVFGARWSLAVGGIAAILAALYGFSVMRKMEIKAKVV